MLRIGVCDDDKEFRQRLVQMIRIWSDHSGIPTELYPFDNGDELIAKNAAFRMDIILLDIVMPLLNGMDTARELRAQDTAVKIIFLTSSPEFALESYEVRAQDYLLKPITYERLRRALEDCSHLFEAEPKNMVLKTSFGFQKLYFHDIEYAEATAATWCTCPMSITLIITRSLPNPAAAFPSRGATAKPFRRLISRICSKRNKERRDLHAGKHIGCAA